MPCFVYYRPATCAGESQPFGPFRIAFEVQRTDISQHRSQACGHGAAYNLQAVLIGCFNTFQLI